MEKNINLLIEHQCPQCGAPAVLEETDRLFFCEFCRVKSYLMPRGVLRYVLPHKAPEDKELIYVPYWRFKGMMFSTLNKGIDHRFLDVSLQAVSSDLFPISLGLRSQSLKLKFTGSETPGRFLQASVPSSAMFKTMDTRFSANLPKPIFHQAHIGETLSLIYSPFYIGDQMMDAVLNRPVSGLLPDDFAIESFKGGPPKWPTEFIPTLCPDCGWDLHGQRDSLALLCYNCNSVWNPSKNGLKSIKFAHIPASNGDKPEGIVYLPFWRIKVEFNGILLESYSDLIKVANLPKAPRPEYDDREFRFWTPAFQGQTANVHQAGKKSYAFTTRGKNVRETAQGQAAPCNPAAERGNRVIEDDSVQLYQTSGQYASPGARNHDYSQKLSASLGSLSGGTPRIHPSGLQPRHQ